MPPSASDVLALVPSPLRGRRDLWVVGGAVRDVLLGRPVRELDLVVEGDAIALARSAGQVVAAHERFGTATVVVDGVTVDLAGARRETYQRPGALPEVELGASLEADLRRRDFTVNAIAVAVADGQVRALDESLADLEARRLRVLHDRSFLDDPTRLLRLARYAARLGMAAEDGTASLAAAAVAGGALGTATGARLGSELLLLLDEPQPAAVLTLEAGGLGAALLERAFAPDAQVVGRAAALCPDDGRAGLAALAAAHARRPGDTPPEPGSASPHRAPDGLSARLDALAMPAREREILVVAATGADALATWLATPRRPSALWERLRRLPVEAVAVAGALDPAAAPAARSWLEDLRHVRPAVTGADLLAAGLHGPAVGAGLDAALRARLDGEAPGRERQLAVALAAARG